jgi:hypothetical protein
LRGLISPSQLDIQGVFLRAAVFHNAALSRGNLFLPFFFGQNALYTGFGADANAVLGGQVGQYPARAFTVIPFNLSNLSLAIYFSLLQTAQHLLLISCEFNLILSLWRKTGCG